MRMRSVAAGLGGPKSWGSPCSSPAVRGGARVGGRGAGGACQGVKGSTDDVEHPLPGCRGVGRGRKYQEWLLCLCSKAGFSDQRTGGGDGFRGWFGPIFCRSFLGKGIPIFS